MLLWGGEQDIRGVFTEKVMLPQVLKDQEEQKWDTDGEKEHISRK